MPMPPTPSPSPGEQRARTDDVYQTIGFAREDAVLVRGKNLCTELIGTVDFTEMFFLELVGRVPSKNEAILVNAVLVALVEHGITANTLASRLTAMAAPESFQGAVAAGLLGAGDVFLGAVEGCARLLQAIPDEEPDSHIGSQLERMRAKAQLVPGLGHHLHGTSDPRTLRLFDLADELRLEDVHRQRLRKVQDAARSVFGKELPINADGAAAAVLSDIGFPWWTCRGVVVLSRCAGLVAHVVDEVNHPTARHVWALSREAVHYRPSAPLFEAAPMGTPAHFSGADREPAKDIRTST